jgi:hypothetical protein
MKWTGIVNTMACFMILGISAPAYARQEKPENREEKAKPARPEQQAKPERQEQEKSSKPEQQAKPEARQQQDNAAKKPQEEVKGQQQHHNTAKTQQQAKTRQNDAAKQPQRDKGQQQQARSPQVPQRTQQAAARQRAQPSLRLSSRGDGRIPDERFRSNFGREHSFRMGNPVLVSGYSRFQYGGYWFGFVEPWPTDWYYTDDVYIDYVDGGYYMYDPYYPGARFAISVVM